MRLNYILGIGIVLSLIGASLLVAFGILYLRPHLDVRHLVEGQCSTLQVTFGDEIVQCTCASDGGSTCQSQYPCVRVRINITTPDLEVVSTNATLYDSQETYVLQADALQCSYHKCSRIAADNVYAVKAFAERMRYSNEELISEQGHYRCYYDPADPSHALLEIVGLSTAVNAVVWPILATVVGLSLFLFQVFHVDAERQRQKSTHQFSSLERQWARIRERQYGRIVTQHSTCSERLVDGNLAADSAANHNASCSVH